MTRMPDEAKVRVPASVRQCAREAFRLARLGFRGGTATGWRRARQLASRRFVSPRDVAIMRAWFARHRFASYPTYAAWTRAGRPLTPSWHSRRGIVAWLLWGGTAGRRWVTALP